MTTLPSAGVFGLVATPTVSPADPASDIRQVTPSLLELEGAHTSPGTNTAVDIRRGAVRPAGFLIAASIFSCLFVGMALAGAVLARSFKVAPAQLPSLSAPAP
jgi:hypothetical protein